MQATALTCNQNNFFDYELKKYKKNTLKIKSNGYMVRVKQRVKFIAGDQYVQKDGQEYLISVLNQENQFVLHHNQNIADLYNPQQDRPYLFARNHSLKIKEKIRIGRIEFAVKEMHYGGGFKLKEEEDYETRDIESAPIQFEERQCKICFDSLETAGNPLVSLCLCKGSVKYIHFGCLRQCIKQKIKKVLFNGVLICQYKKLCCELCGCPYPQKIKQNNVSLYLFDIPRPLTPYVILQGQLKDKTTLYLIQFKENKIEQKIGRCLDSDIPVPHTSVSREHCSLKFIDDNFILNDENSKFGTLIEMSDKLKLDHSKGLQLQIGNVLFKYEEENEITQKILNDNFSLKDEPSMEEEKTPII